MDKCPSRLLALLVLTLVLLAPVAGVADTRVDAGVAPSEFRQHRWLMTVSSVHNFPVVCCLYGQQLINYMEATWLASRVLGRGLVEPIFVHQARDDAVYERLKAQGDPRMFGQGEVFDRYVHANPAHVGFYERYLRGEKLQAGWVSPSDFEPRPLD